jgi:hypothetical protein
MHLLCTHTCVHTLTCSSRNAYMHACVVHKHIHTFASITHCHACWHVKDIRIDTYIHTDIQISRKCTRTRLRYIHIAIDIYTHTESLHEFPGRERSLFSLYIRITKDIHIHTTCSDMHTQISRNCIRIFSRDMHVAKDVYIHTYML